MSRARLYTLLWITLIAVPSIPNVVHAVVSGRLFLLFVIILRVLWGVLTIMAMGRLRPEVLSSAIRTRLFLAVTSTNILADLSLFIVHF